jgi:hypothetical protein
LIKRPEYVEMLAQSVSDEDEGFRFVLRLGFMPGFAACCRRVTPLRANLLCLRDGMCVSPPCTRVVKDETRRVDLPPHGIGDDAHAAAEASEPGAPGNGVERRYAVERHAESARHAFRGCDTDTHAGERARAESDHDTGDILFMQVICGEQSVYRRHKLDVRPPHCRMVIARDTRGVAHRECDVVTCRVKSEHEPLGGLWEHRGTEHRGTGTLCWVLQQRTQHKVPVPLCSPGPASEQPLASCACGTHGEHALLSRSQGKGHEQVVERQRAWELIAPLHHADRVAAFEVTEVVDVVELLRGIEAIQVEVTEQPRGRSALTAYSPRIFEHQVESGAGHVLLDTKGGGDALGEVRFSRAEITCEQDDIAAGEQGTELSSEGFGLLLRV